MSEFVHGRPWPTRVAAASGALMVALGLTALAGWFLHAPPLFRLQPPWLPMTRNAAACFVLCGVALLVVALRKPNWTVVACAGAVGAVSLLTIVEYVFGVNVGIDELLGPADVMAVGSSPGRMWPPATTCFALASMTLLASKTPSKRYALLLGLTSSIIAAIGVAASMGVALGSSAAFGWHHVTTVPPLSALGLLVFGIGMLALAWHVAAPGGGAPHWLPIGVTIVVVTCAVGLWQALIADRYAPFALLPAVVLAGGCLMAPILGLTVYMAQRARAQATALRRSEGRIAGEKRILEMVASGHSLPDVLAALCRFVEDIATECYCAVYLIDWSGPRIRIGAAPSLPPSFNDPISALPVRSESGPCARAASLKMQVIAEDLETDPLWQSSPSRPLALAHGLKSCWSTPILSSAGDVLGTFAVLQRKPASPTSLQQDLIAQVTHLARIAIERAEGEAALQRSEAFLALGQRLSMTGSFVWRLETDEITFSAELLRIFELEHEPVTLDRILGRVHPDDLPLVAGKIELARAGVVDHDYEVRLKMPDESVKYLRTYAHVNRNRDGHLEFAGAMQDVTQQRRSEEALGAARSELARVARVTILGALTASIAHEVNQPLAGIVTNASTCLRMLDADPPNVDGARETARRTIRDGNRASEVITRLRALFGKQAVTTEAVDLNEATREVIALSLSDLQRSRVILQTDLAENLPRVTGDRVQLQQVILNLLMNAVDAMREVEDRSRQLVIRTERDEADRVRVTVQDTGVGFDPRDTERLFEPFYTTKDGGMGIGLSVSRSIIEGHHGRISGTSTRGAGATFSFSLPRSAEVLTSTAVPQVEHAMGAV